MKNANFGESIRDALNSDWRVATINGRTIAFRRVMMDDLNFLNCQFCRADTNLIVVELNRFTPKGKRMRIPLVWGWCAHCDISDK